VHETGTVELDGIPWGAAQDDTIHTSGVRRVTFRNISLHKARTGFSFQFDRGRYCRSYYPSAPVPVQRQFTFDNIRVTHGKPVNLMSVNTPVDVISIVNSSFGENGIVFHGNGIIPDFLPTAISMLGCTFNAKGSMTLIKNSVDGKKITLKTAAGIEVHDGFSARVTPGNGQISVVSDITGLNQLTINN
jgi:hypothetical protein